MPLSEHEQRQLDAIERALYADDPKFASAVRYTDPKVHGRRRVIAGAALIFVGLIVLLLGLVFVSGAGGIEVGVAGFLIMLFGTTRAIAGARRMAGGRLGTTPPPPTTVTPFRRPRRRRGDHPGKSSAGRGEKVSFMERLEERWRRRPEAGPRQ